MTAAGGSRRSAHGKRGAKNSRGARGGSGFDAFYAKLYPQRWPALREALRSEGRHIELTEGLERPYFMDEASYHTALALQPREGSEAADFCAAPGGKTLVLAAAFPSVALTANEKSGGRRQRLRRVLQEHLPPSRLRELRITGRDAALWFKYETEAYDHILLDVPCSSERHILGSPAHLQRWSPARTKHLAIQAFAMLASALEVVRPGGTILYSTCALSPLENDAVVGRLYEKREGRFRIHPLRLPFGEETRYGWQVLPDTAGGRGPMYAAKIERIAT
jgi:16S rRNA C967 or C1407 C5-methylase (RsmB/RsmF family)